MSNLSQRRTIDDYSDIIHLSRPESTSSSPMSRDQRAAQFAPYAALVGHQDIIAADELRASARVDIDRNITVVDEMTDYISDDT